VPLCTYLNRAAGRFARLLARIAANRPAKPHPTKPHPGKPDLNEPGAQRPHRPTPEAAQPSPRLPTGHAWLIRAIPNEAAGYASQLEFLFAEPQAAAFFAAHPAFGRILRPLGRMLGIEALAPKRTRPKPKPKPRPEPETPRIPPPPRAPIAWAHPDPSYRPSAKWPRKPWPARRPRFAKPAQPAKPA
jgi:hypothetical protein